MRTCARAAAETFAFFMRGAGSGNAGNVRYLGDIQ
jgi:hypothetical protein